MMASTSKAPKASSRIIPMRRLSRWVVGLSAGLALLAGCAVAPTGPASTAVPAPGAAPGPPPTSPVPPPTERTPTPPALLGEGMSSPLMDQLREQRGLVYYAACSADVIDSAGQLVIEASTSPAQLDDCLAALAGLLRAQAETVHPQDLERARNQILVRRLRGLDKPGRRLEQAALDVLVLGRLRPHADGLARVNAVSADQVREAFGTMLATGAALALTGRVARGAGARAAALLVDGGLALPV